jgi:hypothetical protein
MMPRKSGWVAALALVGVVGGCSRSPLVSATGKLTCKGQPVPSTRVTFFPEDGSRRSTGVTGDDGKFTLRYSRTEEGVARGRHHVALQYDPSPEEELGKIKPKASRELQDVIAKYRDAKTSGLQFEITESGQQIDIVLP